MTCVEFRDIAVRMVWRTDRGACRRSVPPLISNGDAMVLVDPSIKKSAFRGCRAVGRPLVSLIRTVLVKEILSIFVAT